MSLASTSPRKKSGLAFSFLLALIAVGGLPFTALFEAAIPGANGRIAFVSVRDGNREIYVMNPDGTGQTNITGNLAEDAEPAWSPDGKQIAFQSDRSGNLDVYVMNADGTGVRPVTTDPAADGTPRWSPDGTRLAFTSNRDGRLQIYVMNSDGSGATRLTDRADATEVNPRWSPDGTRIAFSSDRLTPGQWDIYVMASDGTDVTRLTATPGNSYDPAWSSDGTRLLFWNRSNDSGDLHVMNADGSGISPLAPEPADDTAPSWSPDGAEVVFSSNRGGSYGICVMHADGSGARCLTADGDTDPDWVNIPAPPPATPAITWATPADLIYATPLGPDQLNATADVPGTFTYDPPAGTVLQTGAGQTVSARFAPANAAAYVASSSTVRLNVIQASPVLTWTKPAAVRHGSPLGSAQLSATSNVPGTFIYKPGPGVVLPVGARQALSVTFVPADVLNYGSAAAWTTIDVESAAAALHPTYRVLHHFSGVDGGGPEASIVQGHDGAFYGTTFGHGPGGAGALYRMESTGALTVRKGFGATAGGSSYSRPLEALDGQFYATTSSGAENGAGAIARVDAAGMLTTVHAFTWSDGARPNAGLMQASDGLFYGTTSGGGRTGAGTVVRMDATGAVTMLHSFSRADGEFPASGLIEGSDGYLYGTTLYGGPLGTGTVYRLDRAGAMTVVHAFARTDGAYPYAGLMEGTDGNLYGTTISGGPNGTGTVFRLNPASGFTMLHAFSAAEGTNPYAGLVQGTDGFFYGATSNGGPGNAGTVYRMDASGSVALLHAFAGSDGDYAHADLLQARDGFFYGTTAGGGAHGLGTVFRVTATPGTGRSDLVVAPSRGVYGGSFSLSATLTSEAVPLAGEKVSFVVNGRTVATAITDGAGVASVTGLSLPGVHGGTHTILASFAGDAFHAVAEGTADLAVTPATPTVLWPAPADITYGTPLGNLQLKAVASVAGTLTYDPPAGTVLGVGAGHTLTVVFTPANTADHSVVVATTSINVVKAVPRIVWNNPADIVSGTPLGNAQLNASASVPGTLTYTPGAGTVLAVGAGQALTALFMPADDVTYAAASTSVRINVVRKSPILSWAKPAGIGYATPLGSSQLNATADTPGTFVYAPPEGTKLPVGAAQNLSVTFTPSDAANYDTAVAIVTIDINDTSPPPEPTYQVLHSFTGADGATPHARLVEGHDGAFYATTISGGPGGTGTIYRVTSRGRLTVLNGFAAGGSSFARLYAGPEGQLYGTTNSDGPNGAGAVYRMDADGVVSTLHAFNWSDGARPTAGLTQGTDGLLYGTTSGGGRTGAGTVFRVDPSGNVAVLHSFTRADGESPASSLILGTDGYFYGTTLYGGPAGAGTVYRMDTAGAVTVLHAFGRADGAYPYAELFEGSDGNFYGTTYGGGPLGTGTVFRVDRRGAFRSLHGFARSEGTNPYASLIQGNDGFFYGTTSSGGSGNRGTVYRCDASGKVTVLHVFTGAHGASPRAALLLARDGFLYGATATGGAQGAGTLYRVTPDHGDAPAQFVVVSPASAFFGGTVGLSATLRSEAESSPLSGETVRFALDGRTVATVLTDAAGVARATGLKLTGLHGGIHRIEATFAGDALHGGASGTAELVIMPSTPTLTWPAPADINYGTPLGNGQLRATASAAGTFAYDPPLEAVLGAGTHTLSVVFTPTELADNTIVAATASINVLQARPRVVWDRPLDIAPDTALGSVQLNAWANVPGTFAYTPAEGTVLPVGSAHRLSVVFTPADVANYTGQTAEVAIDVPTPVDITGAEELTWLQKALDAATLAPWKYAVYLDGERLVELTGVSCTGTALAGEFLCTAAFPDIPAGVHSLRLSAFTIPEGTVIESGRSAPMIISRAAAIPPPPIDH